MSVKTRHRQGGIAVAPTVRNDKLADTSRIFKEWLAISIAVFSLAFSAGGWFFKVASLEKQIEQIETEYVRKDVLGAQLESIDRRLTNMESGMQKLDIKLDTVSVTLGTNKR